MSLYPLRNVKLVPLTGQDSMGRVSEVIPEGSRPEAKTRGSYHCPWKSSLLSPWGVVVVEARKSQLQCYGYPFWSATGKQAGPSVLGVLSPSQGVAAGHPHWTQAWLLAATCLFKVTPDMQAVSGG